MLEEDKNYTRDIDDSYGNESANGFDYSASEHGYSNEENNNVLNDRYQPEELNRKRSRHDYREMYEWDGSEYMHYGDMRTNNSNVYEYEKNDWALPETLIFTDSRPTDSLRELKNLACEELKNIRIGHGCGKKEYFFNPPNSPFKSSLDYLRELAGNESIRLNIQGRVRRVYAKKDNLVGKIQQETNKKQQNNEYAEDNPDADYSRVINPDMICDKDVKSFNDFDEGIFYLNRNTNMYACPDPNCPKEFPSLSRIKRHYIIHTNIKPFKCVNKECPRCFSRKDNMLQHYRVHCSFTNYKQP